MKEKKEIPSTIEVAGWMALPIGFMWSANFFCTMYSASRPALSVLGTALGFISIYVLYKQLTNFRRLYPTVSWLHVLRLSFVTCLLAGLLTDAAEYVYFNGRFLSQMANAMQSEEYRQALQQIMPGAKQEEVVKVIQNMSVRDIIIQMIMYNILLALPVSLFAALPVRKPKVDGKL